MIQGLETKIWGQPLIKRVGRTYKYYVTALGRRALLAGLQIRETVLPQMQTANG